MMDLLKTRQVLLLLLLATGMTELFAGEAIGVFYREGRTSLSLPVSGVVQQVLVKKGQTARQGETLLKLDTRRIEASLQAAKARVERFRPSRDEAKRELERAEELFDRTVLSEVELQQAKIDYAEKNAALHEARAELTQAKLDLEYSELKAPFDLVVLQPYVVNGQAVVNVMQAVPLIEVATDSLAVVAQVAPERHIDVQAGKKVSLTYGGKTSAGSIVATEFDAGTQKISLHVKVNNQAAVKGYAGHPVKITWQ